LSKHDVELGELQLSCSGTRINLLGTLLKRSGDSFNHEVLNTMLGELLRVGMVSSELTNWDLNSGVRRLEKKKVSSSSRTDVNTRDNDNDEFGHE
jgi:hypothetical protein